VQLSIARVVDEELEDMLVETDIVHPIKQLRSPRHTSLTLRIIQSLEHASQILH